MDKEAEIKSLKGELTKLQEQINQVLAEIEKIKLKLKTEYRRKDKEKYEEERRKITEKLKTYVAETKEINKRLFELEATP